MESNTDFEQERTRLTRRAWRVTGGYAVALFVLSAFVVFGEAGVDSFRKMRPNEVGDLLAGVAGPVAFIWLVYGYFLQGIAIRQQAKELSQNTRALHLQEQALRAQVEELKNSVEQQRELAAAANAQIKMAHELQKPKFSLQPYSVQGKRWTLLIKNIGMPATNVSIEGSSGFGNYFDQSYPLFEKNRQITVDVDNVISPAVAQVAGGEIQHWVSLRYEYGEGYSECQIFDFMADTQVGIGRFVARKVGQ